MSGGSKVVCIYAEELAKLGHSVTIISRAPTPFSLFKKFGVWAQGNGWLYRPTVSAPPGVRHILIDDIRPIVDTDVPDSDVVIATWWETAEWVNGFSPSKGHKVYFIQHHEVFEHLPQRSRDTYRLPMQKVVIARWLKDLMASEYGDRQAVLVPNSVDRFKFYASQRTKQARPTVGLLYSSVDFKGLDTALAAIDLLRKKMPRLRVLSFGSERPKSRFPLPTNSRFSFLPKQDKIRDIYSSCDLWLTASRSEGFNLPALEAMACRTPVVSTRAGWPAEGIVDRINGVLAEVDDVEALCSAMEWILTLPESEWEALSEGAYRTMTTSSWKESARMFEQAISQGLAH
jgi:glycosyltransferase involved in cell wall biosynthesis